MRTAASPPTATTSETVYPSVPSPARTANIVRHRDKPRGMRCQHARTCKPAFQVRGAPGAPARRHGQPRQRQSMQTRFTLGGRIGLPQRAGRHHQNLVAKDVCLLHRLGRARARGHGSLTSASVARLGVRHPTASVCTWVVMMMDRPFLRRRMRFHTSRRMYGSIPVVGSSADLRPDGGDGVRLGTYT